MGAAVTLEPSASQVMPGTQATSGVRVRNTGAVVDQFLIDVVGDAAAWTRVEPETLNLLPGEEGEARVIFAPPRTSQVLEGPVPFAVRVMSREDVGGSSVEESVVTLGGFSDITGELVPRTSTGRRTGRHRLALDNLGNHPELVAVDAYDPDELLDIRVEPSSITLEPGTAVFVKVRARPRTRFLHGPNRSAPFHVEVTPQHSAPFMLPAAMVQQSVLPSWFFKGLAVVALASAAAVALWMLVLKPTVESTAQNVAESETEELAEAITDASERAAQAQTDAAAAQQQAEETQQEVRGKQGKGGEAGENGGAGSAGGPLPASGTLNAQDAIDFRVTTDVPAVGGFSDFEFTPQPGRTVWVSDLVLQNPVGDEGILRIQRGDDVLLVFGLQNFRDLDYHFIQPARFTADDPVVVSVDCTNEAGSCTPSVYFTGQSLRPPAKPARAGGADG